MARILLVDDEPRNLKLLTAYLAPEAHALISAAGGREGLALFERERPDLVLLDLRMPDVDGLAVLRELRARYDHVPVVLVTANADREHRLRGLEAGADEFLEKPVDREILLARVRTLLALKRSRDEIVAQHAALARLQREQRELTAFIVHDLKSPLAVVWSGVEYATSNLGRDPVESLAALTDAGVGLQRLSSLIGDLVVVSQLDHADLPIRRDDVAIVEMLQATVGTHEREARARGLSVHTESEDVHVHGDRSLLARVVENLLDNAIRYTPSGGRISVAARRADGVTICIANSGPPIAEAERGRVFEKFVRGSHAPARVGSAGLGLYFCKRVVEAHGGTIRLEQTPDWPTAFMVHLQAA